ncbi:PAS domain-containing protein [Porphyrobacter sp. YT40]|uniref:PAS domain-containing hybrid sensor histidine kinase/response regulator n=1 Tax=Porphyrobacter sp. YT40 TaxID=2547601 RepID=UPI0015E8E764|nr:PAS domain-containing protein [Porphyrobacter sp. YT40]
MNNAEFAEILDAVSQGVLVFGADRKILYCNQAFLDITGFDRPDVANVLFSIMQGPHTDPDTLLAIEKAIDSGREFSAEIQNYRKTGDTFWYELTFKPKFHQDGTLRHFIGILRDISAQKRAEFEANHLKSAFDEKNNQLELISGFLKNAQRIAKIGVFDYSVGEDRQYWSDELISMLGFPKENFPAPVDVFVSRIDKGDLPLFEELFDQAVRNGLPYEITLKVYRYDGRAMYMQVIADVRDVAGDRRITGIARDVTDETEAAARLLEEKQRFELAAQATLDVIFDWNIETGAYWANEAFETVYGYPAPSHIGLYGLEGISAVKADHDLVRRVTLEAIEAGKERYSVDYSFIRADGKRGHAAVRASIVRDPTGKARRIIGTATDVGQLTDAMTALEASEERFRIIADTVSDVLWDRDFDTDTIWVTPDWPTKLRIAIDSDVRMDRFFDDHVEPEEAVRVQKSFLEAIKSDATEWECQYGLIGSDGSRIDLAVKAAILRNSDGRAQRMLGNARNVTFEVRQQEGFTRARALEAVGQLTGGIAHDFNNQLMIIQGNAELLEMSALDEDQSESAALINQACVSAADLIQRLLSFSRQSHLRSERVEIARLIPNVVALLRAGIPESITVRCKVPPGIWQAKADANALEQAIINLAVNSRDAMPNGGDIIIGCENRIISGDTHPFAAELEPGEYVELSVTDNGHGMAPEVKAKVFEPFFTTKEVGKGTGLGLSTVYGFAKQSNGHVIVYSEPDRGTTVALYLPRYTEIVEQYMPDLVTRSAHPGNGKRILLVEDQERLRDHVCKLLTKMGYKVTSAANGIEALSLLQDGQNFDLLFTDVIMPGGLNGQELAQKTTKLRPSMKVLFTSGYPASAFEHLRLDEVEHIKLLKKPYRSAELTAALAELLEN